MVDSLLVLVMDMELVSTSTLIPSITCYFLVWGCSSTPLCTTDGTLSPI